MKNWIRILTVLALAAALTACAAEGGDSSTAASVAASAAAEAAVIESGLEENENGEAGDEKAGDEAESVDASENGQPANTRMFALGKPFPDFTMETKDGTFTLSEALEGKEAMLINFWATWCGYCTYEFPYIEEAYEKYDGKFGVVALSVDPADTPDLIEKYRADQGLSFPMGQDESGLYGLLGERGVPVSVFIDRFGNVIYKQVGAFMEEEQLNALLEFMMSEEYTETTILK